MTEYEQSLNITSEKLQPCLNPIDLDVQQIGRLRQFTYLESRLLQERMKFVSLNEYESVIQNASKRVKSAKVGIHELGHAIVAKSLNWTVNLISVVPKGKSLGATYVLPSTNDNLKTTFLKGIAVNMGSFVIQEKMGIRPESGTGSDFPTAIYYSNMLSFLGNYSVSPEEYFSQGLALARECLKGIPNDHILSQAAYLDYKGVSFG